MNCLYCNKETSNPKFCSRSCSASFSNKNSPPKRKRTKACCNCETLILSDRTFCKECFKKSSTLDISLQEALYTSNRLHRSSVFALVRGRAKTLFKKIKKVCSKCGYDKHAEVCHIKPISSFPEETMLSEINSLENLILLCPNCHWEFDNGGLKGNRTPNARLEI